jgi:hypothetical protein
MICPHCRASLRQRERPNLTCSKCQRRYALDPKTNSLMAHDILVAKVAERLSDGGKLRYTATQLWYALSRKPLDKKSTGTIGCGLGVAIVVLVLAALCGLSGLQEGNYEALAVAAIVGLAVIAIAVITVANRRARIPTVLMPLNLGEFNTGILNPWRGVYHGDPPGLYPKSALAAIHEPVLAVLCPDRSVLECLQANGVSERLRLALVARVEDVPVGVPVLVLHDASPQGCLLAQRVRRQLPGRRVLDGGLRPRHVMKAKGAVKLRTRPDPTTLATLALEPKEMQWLARGWWSPIGAMRPAGLIRRVEEAARRTDPAQRAAREVGFLTWPG